MMLMEMSPVQLSSEQSWAVQNTAKRTFHSPLARAFLKAKDSFFKFLVFEEVGGFKANIQ